MLCAVVLCRKAGRRLRKAEWPDPVVGRLVIRELQADKNNFRRHIRSAELKTALDAYASSLIDAVPPIFDPVLLASPDGALLIRGIEISIVDDEVYEVEQVWLCKAT